MDRRVVITGIGMVTPLGAGKVAFSRSLWAGETGIREIRAFPTAGLASHLGAEVAAYQPRDFISRRICSRKGFGTSFLLASSRMGIGPRPWCSTRVKRARRA